MSASFEKYLFMENKSFTQLNSSKRNLTGFTIIELMIAVFILLVGILAAFALVSNSIAYSSTYKLQLTAAYLAQEGIEIVRNIRDTNWIDPAEPAWDDGLTSGSDFYNFDYRSQNIPDNSNCSGKEYLKFDGNFYTCSDDLIAMFRRKVFIDSSTADVLDVSVTIEWSERGRDHNFLIQEKIYKWR